MMPSRSISGPLSARRPNVSRSARSAMIWRAALSPSSLAGGTAATIGSGRAACAKLLIEAEPAISRYFARAQETQPLSLDQPQGRTRSDRPPFPGSASIRRLRPARQTKPPAPHQLPAMVRPPAPTQATARTRPQSPRRHTCAEGMLPRPGWKLRASVPAIRWAQGHVAARPPVRMEPKMTPMGACI